MVEINMNKLKIFIILLIVMIMGCATSMQEVNSTVGAGQPLEYNIGYMDGCDSGNMAAGHPYYRFYKDVSRYKKDDNYKIGWDDGFNVCKGKYEAVKNSLRR